ncbi:MAG: PepSY-like domain-containing protein [Muribaculaceae bacterium]|nr:PepSY-like domain-containing protein [Muribaculaceae bacterium]
MKKILRFLPLVLIVLVGMGLSSCSDDDDEKTITETELPGVAKNFIRQYFPDATIRSAQKGNNEYEVKLSDGTDIDFDKEGNWKDVDAAPGQTIPSGFYPEAIDNYIAANMNGTGINEISKEGAGYDVQLLTGVELLFGLDGSFIGYDVD